MPPSQSSRTCRPLRQPSAAPALPVPVGAVIGCFCVGMCARASLCVCSRACARVGPYGAVMMLSTSRKDLEKAWSKKLSEAERGLSWSDFAITQSTAAGTKQAIDKLNCTPALRHVRCAHTGTEHFKVTLLTVNCVQPPLGSKHGMARPGHTWASATRRPIPANRESWPVDVALMVTAPS